MSSLLFSEILALGLMVAVALAPTIWRHLQQRGR